MKAPIFIVGCPRSGTTILSQLLSNSSYCEPFETHYIPAYYQDIHKYGDLTTFDNFKRLVNNILNERPIMQWNLNVDVKEMFSRLNPPDFASIVNDIGLLIAEKSQKQKWGDKTPHYLFEMAMLHNLFPESKFIYIIRDGRDVALSLLDRPWPPFNVLTCAEMWKQFNSPHNQTLEALKEKGLVFILKYEDLLGNTEALLKELYDFIEEDYDPAFLIQLTHEIKKGNYDKWKQKMSSRDIRLFETCAANSLNHFGYKTTYPEKPLNPIISSLYKLHEKALLAKWLFRLNVIDTIKIKFFGKEPFAE